MGIDTNKLEQLKNFTLKKPTDYVDELIEYLKPELNPLTTCFDSFDLVMRHKLRGKLGIICGKGGSKKSLLALQQLVANSTRGVKGIYSTMEMPAQQLLARMIDMTFETDEKPTTYFEKNLVQHEDKIKQIITTGLNEIFGDSVIIDQKGRQTADTYRGLIERHKEIFGEYPKQIVVDGLSMMGGIGNEVELYSNNTKELKDLANEYNCYVALICHVNKSCLMTERNNIEFIRGSEKIVDNMDFCIQMSAIEDTNSSDEYRKDKGVAKLWDKRGSGARITKVYNFEYKNKIRIIETNEDLKNYESTDKYKGF